RPRRTYSFPPTHIHPHTTPPLSLTHTGTTDIYTLSLHDALPILQRPVDAEPGLRDVVLEPAGHRLPQRVHHAHRGIAVPHVVHQDRKSTRLNSSHRTISYAVFCLKKKQSRFCSSRIRSRICAWIV